MKTKKEVLWERKRYMIALRRFIMGVPSKDIRKYIGVDLCVLKKYLEKYFLPDMSWDNYKTVWCIDHIVPMRVFDIFNEEDKYLVFNYQNFFPMLLNDNKLKESNCYISKMLLDELPQTDIVISLKEKIKYEINFFDKYIDKTKNTL